MIFWAPSGYKALMFDIIHDTAVKDFMSRGKIRESNPDLEMLGRLMRGFLKFPYENLTKIIRAKEEGDPIKRLRMPDIVMGDHIELGTGGTCFSLTYFFRQILVNCGFSCTIVLCDRSYGPDTHCALVVSLNSARYLVDPGYLLQNPIMMPLRGSSIISTPFSEICLKRLGDTSHYLLITTQGGRSTIRYRLKDVSVDAETFKGRWIDSFSWAQMRHLCVTRLSDAGHVYLRDAHLRHSTIDKKSKEKLKTGFEKTVSETFGIDGKIIECARDYIYELKLQR